MYHFLRLSQRNACYTICTHARSLRLLVIGTRRRWPHNVLRYGNLHTTAVAPESAQCAEQCEIGEWGKYEMSNKLRQHAPIGHNMCKTHSHSQFYSDRAATHRPAANCRTESTANSTRTAHFHEPVCVRATLECTSIVPYRGIGILWGGPNKKDIQSGTAYTTNVDSVQH